MARPGVGETTAGRISALSIWVTARFCPMARILRQCFCRWLKAAYHSLRGPVVAAVKSAAGARDYRASRRRRAGLTFTFLAVALCGCDGAVCGLGQYNIPIDQVVASGGPPSGSCAGEPGDAAGG